MAVTIYSSGVLACTGVVAVDNNSAPDGGTGSILLVDGAAYQDVNITCTATLDTNCDNAGIVFSYIDHQNYWVEIYSKAQQKKLLYQISSGSWALRKSSSFSITGGSAFTMETNVGAGAAGGYAATIPAGQVGLWCSDSSDNDFDDFQVQDIAGPFEVDGKWFCNSGEVRVDNSDNNLIETYGSYTGPQQIVRRGLRADEYVATFKLKWAASIKPGLLVRWLDPGNWLAVEFDTSDGKARLKRRKDDALVTTLSTSFATLSLTAGNWYTAKVVIDKPAASQRLRCWVDTDGDGSYADESVLLNTGTVDDDWSAGCIGLYKGDGMSTTHQFDDFTVGFDNNADDDIADAGDDILVSDDFSSTTISLSYDDNGNLTDDGVYNFVYDAWNRLRKAQLTESGDTTTIGEYEYYGDTRRSKKNVSNRGAEIVANDGGDTTGLFYYDRKWRIVETRNGSNQTTCQHLWGTRYTDELLWIEKNGDPTESNDTNPDDQSGESTADSRYFVHQDRNWNVTALTEYDTSGTNNGRTVERYSYSPYGNFVVLKGDSGNGELSSFALTSTVGNPVAHQGLAFDHDKGSYQNRWREYATELQRFVQRDPVSRVYQYTSLETVNLYLAYLGAPTLHKDPKGLCCICCAFFVGLGHKHNGVCVTSAGAKCKCFYEGELGGDGDIIALDIPPGGLSNCGKWVIPPVPFLFDGVPGKDCSAKCVPIWLWIPRVEMARVDVGDSELVCTCSGWIKIETCCKQCD